MLKKRGNRPGFLLVTPSIVEWTFVEAKHKLPTNDYFLLGKGLVGISAFTLHWQKKYFSLICSRNSAVQPFSLVLKPVQEGNRDCLPSGSSDETPEGLLRGTLSRSAGSRGLFYAAPHKDYRPIPSGAGFLPSTVFRLLSSAAYFKRG